MSTLNQLEKYSENVKSEITTRKQFVFLPTISMLFVSCLIIANIVASKPLHLYSFTIPGGALIFPVDYLVGNILTEVYGFKWARILIYSALFCNLLVTGYIVLVQHIHPAIFWHHQEAYNVILGIFPKVVIASSLSYLFGEYLNSATISRLKVLTRGRYLWIRAIFSTLFGSVIDSLIFIPIVFYASANIHQMINLGVSLTIFKVGYEILGLPLTYCVVSFLKKSEGIDVYDYNTNYSPFSINLKYSAVECRGER